MTSQIQLLILQIGLALLNVLFCKKFTIKCYFAKLRLLQSTQPQKKKIQVQNSASWTRNSPWSHWILSNQPALPLECFGGCFQGMGTCSWVQMHLCACPVAGSGLKYIRLQASSHNSSLLHITFTTQKMSHHSQPEHESWKIEYIWMYPI